MLTIGQRPFDPLDRSQAGHWEGDLIIGKDQASAIGTLVERQTRMMLLPSMPYRDSHPPGVALQWLRQPRPNAT
jgi:transposase, IS30 family